MQTQQLKWTAVDGWKALSNVDFPTQKKCLVFAFGNRFLLEAPQRFEELKDKYPNADILMNSTSGEIVGSQVAEESIVVTAVFFERTSYTIALVNTLDVEDGYLMGKSLAEAFDTEGLRHLFIISDGQAVNGSELVKGLNDCLPQSVTSTGGLAGDGARFEKTLVGLNAAPSEGNVVAVGFYGTDLKIGYGSVGGWTSFGPERMITKAKGNVLYELDGKSALELYKRYLGDKASGLPGTGLLFPLSIKLDKDQEPLVRTILAISEEEQSMTFAGDLPEGATARLMKANFDKLIDGAFDAANSGKQQNETPELALLISCVGRKLVLDQRIEEEVESILEVVGEDVAITGFYSYGEIAPFAGQRNCELHNQTMTVTLLSEN